MYKVMKIYEYGCFLSCQKNGKTAFRNFESNYTAMGQKAVEGQKNGLSGAYTIQGQIILKCL